VIRAWNKPFAFILNQNADPRPASSTTRPPRLATRRRSIPPESFAQPFIVMRNDHQDALERRPAVNEYAPASKSAEEIRSLGNGSKPGKNAGAAVQEVDVAGGIAGSAACSDVCRDAC